MSYVDVLNIAEYGTNKIFRGIKAGDRVRYMHIDRWSELKVIKSGKVNAMLLFPDHVVLNVGNFGVVVDEGNYVSHSGGKK